MSRFKERFTNGFIIGSNQAPNNVIYLQIFTKELGVITAKAKVSPKLTGKFQGKLEPLTKAMFVLYKGQTTWSIKEITNVQNTHLDLVTHPIQELIHFICKIYRQLLPEDQPLVSLFVMLEQVQQNIANHIYSTTSLIYFLAQTLDKIGILPNLKTCPGCQSEITGNATYDPTQQEIFCTNCIPNHSEQLVQINLNQRKTIYYATKINLIDFNKIQIHPNIQANSIRLLQVITANYLGKSPSLVSLPI